MFQIQFIAVNNAATQKNYQARKGHNKNKDFHIILMFQNELF